jgi:Tfp pilus assembly protein PilF
MTGTAQQPATVKEYLQSFPTYGFSDPNPIPLLSPVYPYFRYDGFTDKAEQKKWKIVELQNDYIKVLITPEIGGKIWTAIEKKSGKSFIYYNHTVKFRDIAMRGPWTSGGLEPNYGIIGHTPSNATPVDYIARKNDDGSVSCIIGVLDLLTRSNWRIEINLPKDKAYFTTQSFWYNSTPVEQPYYHWMNLGIKAKGNLEFIFPGTKYIGHNGEHADWPVNKTNGKKINFYEENNFGGYKSYHVFGKPADFFGAYWHDDNTGMVRYGTYDDKAGRKIWIWGLSQQGMIWEKLLTDTDGQYVEIQSGRLFNQNAEKSSFTPFKHIAFAPYATDTWKEYWYPVSQTHGIAKANAYGALNVKYENGLLKIYFSAAQLVRDTLVIKAGEKTVYSKPLNLAPLQVFADSLQVSINAKDIVAVLGNNKLVYYSDPEFEVLNRPVSSPADFNWNTAYGLYVQGKEYMDQKMYGAAEEKLTESLGKDSNYLPALVKMAELLYRNMRYTEALKIAARALSIDTHAGDANYYYGIINAQLGNIADAKDGFSIASLTPEYRSAAYTGLSRLYNREKDFDKAIAHAAKAIDFNRYNIDALMLQAAALRSNNDTAKAEAILKIILSYDPLNHFARFEKYLQQQTEEAKKTFVSLVRNELPAETFAELAAWYYNAGYADEALKVFSLGPKSAEATFWMAFLQNKKADCNAIDPELVFLFRSETAMVLEHLLKSQNDWLLKYQLALIYKDRNREAECKQLLLSCGDLPSYAPFYATRAVIFGGSDTSQSLRDLQKALTLDKTQWRYYKMLGEYYNEHQQPQKALAVVAPFYKDHPEQYIMGMLYAKTLMLNKKYKEADAVLAKLNIIPFEGATEGKGLYREAKLMMALQEMQRNNYRKALTFIRQSRLWPQNLGVGKPYDNEIDSRLEDWMEYACNRKMNKKGNNVLLERILQFTPRIDNTVSNFIPSNALVSAWAIEKKEGKAKAGEWIDQQIILYPHLRKALEWSRDMFENNKPPVLPDTPKDAGMRILEALVTMGEGSH